jgi:hypothetical protein
LRLEEFAITNFRTFTTRTVIPFRGNAAEPDAIATFHGDNGSGKSNALAALNLFFHALIRYLNSEEISNDKDITLDWGRGTEDDLFALHPRDRPVDAEGPTELEARFADERLGTLLVRFTPAGKRLRLRAERSYVPLFVDRDRFLTWIESPFGPGSYPCAILDSHRHASFKPRSNDSSLDATIAEELFKLRTSFQPQDRARWRSFTEQLQRFSTLQGREVSIDRLPGRPLPELTFEERGKSVLPLRELSSGEQQLVRLCAVTTLAAGAILGIQEPELSLDITNQKLLLEILCSQIQMGLRDQIILESHVFTFDGPSVIRFSRTASGPTQVTRAPSATQSDQEFSEKALAKGAKKQFVTRDGYTQLPDIMLKDLQFVDGGHLWFLKGKNAWEAWREEDLTTLLAEPETDKDHG